MQYLGMKIEINGKVLTLDRVDEMTVRAAFEGEQGCSTLGIGNRETAFEMAVDLATDAYGKRRRGKGPNCTNSMISDIADAIERVAGC